MENASKALIIAGSILISILLISVGILVFNSTSGLQNRAKQSSDTMAISSFNAQFESYEGAQSGKQVKSLIDAVLASNAVNADNQITVNTKTTSADISALKASYASNTKYTVTFGYDDSGYINVITVA